MECILGVDLIPSLNSGARYILAREHFTDKKLIKTNEGRMKTIGCMYNYGHYSQLRRSKQRGVSRPIHIMRY